MNHSMLNINAEKLEGIGGRSPKTEVNSEDYDY